MSVTGSRSSRRNSASRAAISPESTSQLTTVTANRVVGPSNTNLTFNLGTNSSGSTLTSHNTSYSIQQTQNFGGQNSITFHFSGSQSASDNIFTNDTTATTTTNSNRNQQEVGDVRATA